MTGTHCAHQVPRLQEAGNAALWGRLLAAALTSLGEQAGGGCATAPEDDVVDVEEFSGVAMQGTMWGKTCALVLARLDCSCIWLLKCGTEHPSLLAARL